MPGPCRQHGLREGRSRVQARLRHADGRGVDLGPAVERIRLIVSSAGQTPAAGGASLTVTASCIRAAQRTVADGERQRVCAGRGERRVGRGCTSPPRTSRRPGPRGPLICQRRGRTVVRCRAGQRHRRVRQRRCRVSAGVDGRRCIRRRRCRRIVAAATAAAARSEDEQRAHRKKH